MLATPEATARPGVGLERPALVVSRLTKSYGERQILAGVDLVVPPGQVLALIGANGTGKSTLLRCLIRLVEPSSGSIHALGQDVTRLDRKGLAKFRSRAGFVFQKHNLVPRLSALTNVVHGVQARMAGPRTWLQSLSPAAVRDEAMACLEAVDLAHVCHQRADSLSCQRRRKREPLRRCDWEPLRSAAGEARRPPRGGLRAFRVFVGGGVGSDRRAMAQ